jgi:hypothetical protein
MPLFFPDLLCLSNSTVMFLSVICFKIIYFGKKNVEKRPYNFNLKLSHQRDRISFGPSTPNDFDLKLALDVALENGVKCFYKA